MFAYQQRLFPLSGIPTASQAASQLTEIAPRVFAVSRDNPVPRVLETALAQRPNIRQLGLFPREAVPFQPSRTFVSTPQGLAPYEEAALAERGMGTGGSAAMMLAALAAPYVLPHAARWLRSLFD